jgi:hypothetical protein
MDTLQMYFSIFTIEFEYPTLKTGWESCKHPKCPWQSAKFPWHVAQEKSERLLAGPWFAWKNAYYYSILGKDMCIMKGKYMIKQMESRNNVFHQPNFFGKWKNNTNPFKLQMNNEYVFNHFAGATVQKSKERQICDVIYLGSINTNGSAHYRLKTQWLDIQ